MSYQLGERVEKDNGWVGIVISVNPVLLQSQNPPNAFKKSGIFDKNLQLIKGKMKFRGKIYHGTFKGEYLCGVGKITDEMGTLISCGEYKQDALCGKGRKITDNGYEIGMFTNNELNGVGVRCEYDTIISGKFVYGRLKDRFDVDINSIEIPQIKKLSFKKEKKTAILHDKIMIGEFSSMTGTLCGYGKVYDLQGRILSKGEHDGCNLCGKGERWKYLKPNYYTHEAGYFSMGFLSAGVVTVYKNGKVIHKYYRNNTKSQYIIKRNSKQLYKVNNVISEGEFTLLDGSPYISDKKMVLHGKGIQYDKNNILLREGEFRHGVLLNGKSYENGCVYTVRNGRTHKKGKKLVIE